MAIINSTLVDSSIPLTVTIGKQVVWVDEWDWTPVSQSVRLTLDGTLVIETLSGLADGRPITLEVKKLTKSVIDSLILLRDRTPPQTSMTLTLPNTETHTVYFRHHEGVPLVVEPIMKRPDYSTGYDFFNCTIKLFKQT